MPSQRNIDQLKSLEDKFSRAKSVVFTDHTGLPVAGQTELRAQVKELGAEFTVAKNTLLLRLLKSLSVEELPKNATVGPTGMLISYADEVSAIKALAKFIDKYEKPAIKAGLLGKASLSMDRVIALSKLPEKTELLGQFLRQLQSPMSGMVNVFMGNLTKLVMVLSAIEMNKFQRSE